ncbi:MAG: hypothetical protein WCP46_09125, partial [Alphaproteobacteria bacterium]
IKSAKNCNEFQKLGKDANGHVEVSAEQPMTNFPEPLQVILDKVAPNQVAGPVQDGSEVSFFMVCTVKNPEKEILPSKKEIKLMLEQKEFSRRASSLLNKFMAVARIAVTDESAPAKNANVKSAKRVESAESEQAQ